jgi:uncharacterized protein YndB with AHSA1/START domain
VDPVTLEVTIDRPREVVFDYLADVANHAEFTDHYLKDWRLTRLRSSGTGAGARYRVDKRLNRFGWADMNLIEVKRPWRIVAVGRGGKYNRIKTFQSWELEPASGGGTKVEWTYETEPALPTDRLVESFGRYRRWSRRRGRRALKRLQSILEEDRGRGTRATVGGL